MIRIDDRRLADPTAEVVRRSHADAIRELDRRPVIRVVRNVVLPDSVHVTVAHRLGAPPSWLKESTVRGAATAGVVVDFESADPNGVPIDRTQSVVIMAVGFGATITVDVMFVLDQQAVTA